MAGIHVPNQRPRIGMATVSFVQIETLRAMKIAVDDAELVMSEDAAKELMQALAQHFGVTSRDGPVSVRRWPRKDWRPQFIRIKED